MSSMSEDTVAPDAALKPLQASRLHRITEAFVYLAGLLVLWEGIVYVFAVPAYVFPAPRAVALALWYGLSSGVYPYHLGVTLFEVFVGFFAGSLTGLLLGIGMVTVPFLNRVLYPYVIGIQTVPKVAIAPLMIVWFGFGVQSKIILVGMACMFPVLVNTIAGLRSTESDRLALVRAMCGSRLQVLRYVQLPSALPYIFAGLNTAIVLAVIGAIVGEFVGARVGIGVLILQANFALDLASVFALLVLLSASGVILNAGMHMIERRVCFWSGRSSK
jgi:NitT/TauT family transport system permease protein